MTSDKAERQDRGGSGLAFLVVFLGGAKSEFAGNAGTVAVGNTVMREHVVKSWIWSVVVLILV